MSKLKRLITLGLSSLLVLSISMTSLASGLGGNTNSGGSEGIGDDPAYAHKFMAYPENQGYRISIVDRQGNRVTNSVDIVNYIPTDIDSIGGDNSTHGASVYKTGYQKYKSYIGWKDYSDLGLNKSNSYYFSNGIKTEEYKGTTWNKKGVPVNVTAKGNIGTNMYPKVAFEIFLSDVYNTEVKKKVAAGEQGLKEVTPEDVKIPLPSVLNADKTAFYPGGVELITLMKSTVGHMGEDINSTDNILTLMVNSKMPIYNHIGKNTEKTDYLFRFVDPADSSRIGKKEIDKETGEEKITTNAGIITEKGYKVIIEPVYWFVPEILSIHPEALERNNNSPHFGWITAVCYGTVSYLAKYAEHIAPDLFGIDVGTEKANELNSLTWVGPDWGTANLGTTTLMLEETDEELKIKEPSAANPPMEHISNSFNYLSIQTLASGDRYKSVGYAVHIYDNLLGNTGTSTFDEVNYGPSSPNGYKPGPSEDKSTEGGKEQQNNIIKYYSRKAGDTYTYIDNTIRKETISPIEIEDEIGYSVDSWFTSPTLKEPTSKSDSYTDVKNSIPNTQNCSDTGTVTLEKGQSLYVRLVKTPAVVKVYTTGENVDKVITEPNPNFNDNKYTVITPDSGYEFTESKKTPNTPIPDIDSWNDTEGTPGTDTVVNLEDDTTTIYIHYNKDVAASSGLVLHENEISKNFTLSDVTGSLHEAIRTYNSVSAPSCPNEWSEWCDNHEEYHTTTCGEEMSETDAGSYSFTLSNRAGYNKQFVYKWVESNTSFSGDGPGHGGGTRTGAPDGAMTLSRAISDKPTLYPGMNSDKSDLNAMGIVSESYKPAGSRNGGADQPNRKQWNETFTTNWQFEGVSDPTITFEHCDESDSAGQSSSGDTDSLNKQYSQPNNTTVYGLWGKANNGLLVPDDSRYKFTIAGLQFGTNRGHLDKSKTIQFYPFYKMNYETLDRGKTDVYLTSENLSQLLNINRVDTALLRTGAARGLNLDSYQWSTHAKVQRGLSDSGISDRNSVLPAGGIYTLSTGGEKASDCWIGVRLFSSYVSDKGKLVNADGIKNLAEVQSSVDGFKGQVQRVLEEYEIVLHGVEGIDINEDNFYENSKQVTGKAGVYQLGGQKLAEDGKYDLKTGGTGANRSDLDIIDSKEEIYDWRLRADADGNITVFGNGELLETISKSSGTIKNTDVYELDQRTKIVSNFMLALDRNLGSDRSGSKWYNEGFEEVGLYEVRLAYKLGFGGAEPVRSAALNIKLSGLLESKSDLYNFSDSSIKEKARTFKFYTSRQSNAAEASGKGNGYIGTYEGQDIIVPSIHGLLQSKLFYTSNGTVTDTN